MNIDAAQHTLLLIDTGFNDCYTFNTFIQLAKDIGFKAECKQSYQVKSEDLKNYDAIFITIDDYFMNAYLKARGQSSNPLVGHIAALLETLKLQKNKLLGIFFSSHVDPNNRGHFDKIKLISSLSFEFSAHLNASLHESFAELFLADNLRSSWYETALLPKKDKEPKKLVKPSTYITDVSGDYLVAGLLPLYFYGSPYALAWYGYNARMNNHYIIAKKSLIFFNDLAENFTYCPIDFELRKKFLDDLHELLYELKRGLTDQRILKKNEKAKPSLPEAFTYDYQLQQKEKWSGLRGKQTDTHNKWMDEELLWCGWTDITGYKGKEESAIESILKSKLNILWCQLSPESFLSTYGNAKKDNNAFYERVKRFTHALKIKSEEAKLPAPYLFVGTELTGNFSSQKVKNPVVDVYGNLYSKVPSPFDMQNLWRQEFCDVFDRLFEQWPSISNGIPLAGVFFDFEMYHAQDQAAHYTGSMDFSPLAWKLYYSCVNNPALQKLKRHEERIGYLLTNNKFDEYFECLKNESVRIGKYLKAHIAKKLPHALIAIYDIFLPCSWYYRGMFAGLSTPARPVTLATFNTTFYPHYEWLKSHDITAYHLPVLLLSKFKNNQDFDFIKKYASLHDGIWFNKISRLEESRDPKTWGWDYSVETTPLETTVFMDQLSKQIADIQNKTVHTKITDS